MATLKELLAMQDKGIEKKKPRKRSLNEEHYMQCAEVRYMRAKHPDLSHIFFSVPNGTKRTTLQTQWLKEEGLVPGVSDMILLKPNSQHGYLCIENKTPKGKQSPEQVLFQEAVEQNGGKYIIIRSLDEFMKAIEQYLNGEL